MFRLNRMSVIRQVVWGASLLVSILALSGCATEKGCSTKPTFFPPPPDKPRIQWLTGISSSDDLGEKKEQSSFSLFLTGREKPDIIRKIGKSYGIGAYNNKLYVAEAAYGRVVVVDPVNGTMEYLKGLSTPKGALKTPVNLAFDKNGNLYVADTGRKEIVVYDKHGNYVSAFGRDLDKAAKIVDVAFHNGELYALDLNTSRIRVLDPKTGQEKRVIGYIEKPNESLRAPGNLTIDDKGNIYVSNIGNNKIMKYDIDGNFLGSFGGTGERAGSFIRPRGVSVDDEGRIYVVDAGFNVVQLFDDQFRLLTLFGWPGLETGSLNLPAGIVVTKDNLDYYQRFAVPGFKLERLIFVVNQYGQDWCVPRVSVYGLGKMEGVQYDTPPPAKTEPVTETSSDDKK
jgi:sugar lactone lactonase YvrE